MTADEQEEFFRDETFQDIGRRLHLICEKGFCARPVRGTRQELVDLADCTVAMYADDEIPLDEAVDFETRERSYTVGTVRWGIDGIVVPEGES